MNHLNCIISTEVEDFSNFFLQTLRTLQVVIIVICTDRICDCSCET